MFALHSVLYPGQPLALRVFEERYLRMMEDVVPHGRFVVAAIRTGREVGGPSEPYRVGVAVSVLGWTYTPGGIGALEVVGHERVALIEPVRQDPYPVWRTEPRPDEGTAGSGELDAALRALRRFAAAARGGAGGALASGPAVPGDPVAASYALAAAVPALVPQAQALLEASGASERLRLVREAFILEARLIAALQAGVGGANPSVNPN